MLRLEAYVFDQGVQHAAQQTVWNIRTKYGVVVYI